MPEARERWEDLEVWELADQLALDICKVSRHFPKEEIYGIASQLRRAALSIPTNIVEGYSRRGDRELARFIDIALGSLAETKYLLLFSHKLGYLNDGAYRELSLAAQQVGGKLWKFYRKVQAG